MIITILIICVLKRNRKGISSKQTGQIEAKIVSNHRGSKQIKPNNVHNHTQSEIMDTSVVALGVSWLLFNLLMSMNSTNVSSSTKKDTTDSPVYGP